MNDISVNLEPNGTLGFSDVHQTTSPLYLKGRQVGFHEPSLCVDKTPIPEDNYSVMEAVASRLLSPEFVIATDTICAAFDEVETLEPQTIKTASGEIILTIGTIEAVAYILPKEGLPQDTVIQVLSGPRLHSNYHSKLLNAAEVPVASSDEDLQREPTSLTGNRALLTFADGVSVRAVLLEDENNHDKRKVTIADAILRADDIPLTTHPSIKPLHFIFRDGIIDDKLMQQHMLDFGADQVIPTAHLSKNEADFVRLFHNNFIHLTKPIPKGYFETLENRQRGLLFLHKLLDEELQETNLPKEYLRILQTLSTITEKIHLR